MKEKFHGIQISRVPQSSLASESVSLANFARIRTIHALLIPSRIFVERLQVIISMGGFRGKGLKLALLERGEGSKISLARDTNSHSSEATAIPLHKGEIRLEFYRNMNKLTSRNQKVFHLSFSFLSISEFLYGVG